MKNLQLSPIVTQWPNDCFTDLPDGPKGIQPLPVTAVHVLWASSLSSSWPQSLFTKEPTQVGTHTHTQIHTH